MVCRLPEDPKGLWSLCVKPDQHFLHERNEEGGSEVRRKGGREERKSGCVVSNKSDS